MGHCYAVMVLAVINLKFMAAVKASWRRLGRLHHLNDPIVFKAGVEVRGSAAAVRRASSGTKT